MNFDQMYDEIFCGDNELITIGGRPGIGKTKIAIEIAAKYITEEQVDALYVVGRPTNFFLERVNALPDKIKKHLIVMEEPHQCSNECNLAEKVCNRCDFNEKIGLVIFDDGEDFDISEAFILYILNHHSRNNIKFIFLSKIDKESEKRAKCKPKLADFQKALAKHNSSVFAIYKENYYYSENNSVTSEEYEFLKLK